MDPLVIRVAQRFLAASLERELTQRWEKLLAFSPQNPPPEAVQDFRTWVAENFKLSGRVPKEGKRAQMQLDRFWRGLELAASKNSGVVEGIFSRYYGELWKQISRDIPDMVKYLSVEGGQKSVPVFQKKVGGNTFVNLIGAGEDRFDEMISTIEGVFSGLNGWRKKALDGGLHVVFAGPKDFNGTASGKYRSEQDQLWIRATPGGRIQKAGGGYGGLAYVITHELGHRYERKHHVPFDFDRPEWHTTAYSKKDGEAFAELFALSNFGITNQGGALVIPKFEHLMATGGVG